MTAKEIQEILDSRIEKMEVIRAKIDFIYKRTADMLVAMDRGADKDECFDYWVKLFNEDLSKYSKEEKRYFTDVCTGLVGLVDGWVKVQ